MGTVTTTYDIQTRYLLQDQVSGGAARMGSELRAAHGASEGFKRSLLGLAGAVGVGFGLHAMYEKVKNANMEMVNLQKRVTGTHFAFNQWGANVSTADRMKASIAMAAEMGERLEGVARSLHLELDPVATIYDSMAASAGKLGMSQEATLSLVQKLAAATRVYGVDAGTAAWTVSQALETGTLRGAHNFTKMLRARLNLKEEGKGIGGLEMVRRISEGLGGTVEASQMMGTGLEGTLADMHRESAALIRTLTGPAFKEVTRMLKEWVEYSAKNREHVEAVAKQVAGVLVGGLTAVKDITIAIHDHWKEIAALLVASKLPGILAATGAAFSGAAGLGAAGAGAAAGASGGIVAGAAGLLGGAVSIPTLTLAAATVYLSASHIEDHFNEKQAWEIGMKGTGAGVKGGTMEQALATIEQYKGSGSSAASEDVKARILSQQLRSMGMVGEDGKLLKGNLANVLSAETPQNRLNWAKAGGMDVGDFVEQMGIMYGDREGSIADAIANKIGEMLNRKRWTDAWERMHDDLTKLGGRLDARADLDQRFPGVNLPKPATPPVKVTINRIEVISDDPDRFAFGLDELVQTAASRKGLTPGTLPAGFHGG